MLALRKPKILIASSTESSEFARAIRYLLRNDGEISVWNEGVFGPGKTTLDSLLKKITQSDFAIIVAAADDLTISRKKQSLTARDNVIFELGLFIGHLGLPRTFIIAEDNPKLKLPSDLAGFNYTKFDPNHEDPKTAVGAACDEIRSEIERESHRPYPVLLTDLISEMRMTSWEAIYKRAAQLVRTAERRICATAFESGPWRGSPDYLKAIVEAAVKQKNENNPDFHHRIIYGSSNDRSGERSASIAKRKDLFLKNGVINSLDMKERSDCWSLDVLLVDRKHMHMSFQNIKTQRLVLGLEFSNTPEIVEPIAQWYDESLFASADPIRDVEG